MEELKKIIKVPEKAEVASLAKTENEITSEYVKKQAYYRFFVSAFLEEKLGLSRLDKRIAEKKILTVEEKNKNFYQRYECSNMKYLYIRSYVHVERLSLEELEILTALDDTCGEKEILKAVNLVENTWRKVLELNYEFPERMVEEYPSIDGSGRYKGDTVLLGLSSAAEYDEKGNFIDRDREDGRRKMILSVAKQLEQIASRTLQANVRVVVEL